MAKNKPRNALDVASLIERTPVVEEQRQWPDKLEENTVRVRIVIEVGTSTRPHRTEYCSGIGTRVVQEQRRDMLARHCELLAFNSAASILGSIHNTFAPYSEKR